MAIGPDFQAGLMALNRFGFGSRGGASDLAHAASDPRGALKAELAQPAVAQIDSPGLLTTEQALKAFYDDAQRQKLEREQAAKGQSAAPAANNAGMDKSTPAMSMAGPSAETNGKPAGTESLKNPPEMQVAQTLFRDEALARFRSVSHADVGFVERLVHFWSNHFCVSAAKGEIIRASAGSFEREAIRPNVLGRFAEMLLAVESHPAMLSYLDNAQSLGPNSIAGQKRKRGLNENLAREICELHTLGVDGGYTQADVTSLARILTGWTVVGPQADLGRPGIFAFFDRGHEPGDQMLLAKVYPARGAEQGRAALVDLARHPSTAKHISRKFARHFIADDPPDGLVAHLESVFRDSDGDLKAMAIALIESDDAWAKPSSKVRSSEEFMLAAIRALDRVPEDPNPILGSLTAMGQPLWQPPGPNGWPDTVAAWASSEGLKARLDASAAIAARTKEAIDPNELLQTIAGDAATRETRQAVARAETRQQGLALLLMSPEFQRR